MKRNAIQTWEAAACQRSFAEGMVTGAMITGLGGATRNAPQRGGLGGGAPPQKPGSGSTPE